MKMTDENNRNNNPTEICKELVSYNDDKSLVILEKCKRIPIKMRHAVLSPGRL